MITLMKSFVLFRTIQKSSFIQVSYNHLISRIFIVAVSCCSKGVVSFLFTHFRKKREAILGVFIIYWKYSKIFSHLQVDHEPNSGSQSLPDFLADPEVVLHAKLLPLRPRSGLSSVPA
jgi:hypothetical protein